MNYRHAFHAGNFADVLKHAALARIIAYLKQKPAAFRVSTPMPAPASTIWSRGERTGEWRDGIGKRPAADRPGGRDGARALSRRWPGSTRGRLQLYPGSPAIVRAWLRRRTACSSRARGGRGAALAADMRGDKRVKAVAIDGWTALNAYVPPQGAARPGADRSAVRAAGRVRPPREALAGAPQMADRHLHALVPDQGHAGDGAFAAGSPRLGIPRILRAELPAAPGDRAAARRRADHRQSALDARRTNSAGCFRRWRTPRRRSPAGGSTGSPAKSERCGGAPLSSRSGCCLL